MYLGKRGNIIELKAMQQESGQNLNFIRMVGLLFRNVSFVLYIVFFLAPICKVGAGCIA